ncbi:MAG: phosphopantetheine-binding protein [Fibrobacterales bacterium]
MMSTISWKEFSPVICDHLGMEPDEISETTNIYEDIGIDSLGIMTLGVRLQTTFKINVPLSSVSSITTLGGMLTIMNDYIESEKQ